MSTIQTTPFIKKVIGTLTTAQKSALIALMNGGTVTPSFKSLINPSNFIAAAFKGVNHIVLETQDRKFTGYLIYNDTYCVMVAYVQNSQELTILKIDLESQKYEIIPEELSILELRMLSEDPSFEDSDFSGSVTIGDDLTVADDVSIGGDLIMTGNIVAKTGADVNVDVPVISGTYGNFTEILVEGGRSRIDVDSTGGIYDAGVLEVGGNATVTGAIKGTTVEQTEANFTIPVTPSLPTGIEVSSGNVPYTAIKVINGVLWFVCVIDVTNTSENAYSGAFTVFPAVSIPEAIAEKIYRADGTKVSEAYSTRNFISAAVGNQGNTLRQVIIGSYSPNVINLYVDSFTLAAGGSADISFRIPIILL